MQFENLPSALKTFVTDMKYQSLSIQNEVNDALDQAENLEEFKDNVINALASISQEVSQVENLFETALVACAKNSSSVQKDNKGGDKTPETT